MIRTLPPCTPVPGSASPCPGRGSAKPRPLTEESAGKEQGLRDMCSWPRGASPGLPRARLGVGAVGTHTLSVYRSRGHVQLKDVELVPAPRPLRMSSEMRNLVPSPSVGSVSMTRRSPWPRRGGRPPHRSPGHCQAVLPGEGEGRGRDVRVPFQNTLCTMRREQDRCSQQIHS